MFGRRIRGILFIIFVVIGLMSLGGYLGYSQGFAAGNLAAANADGGTAFVPYPYYGFGFFPFFFGFGLIFKFAFFILLFFFIARLFRFWAWRTAGGLPSGPGPWGKHQHHPHGPPPWHREDREPSETDSGDDAPRSA